MVDYRSARLDAVFHALADPTRRAMLHRLAEREHSVGELAEPYRMTLAAASKHIKALERAGLVQRTVLGRTHVCRLEAGPLHGGFEWLRHYERYWNDRLDSLEALLRAEDQAASGASAPKAKPSAARKKTAATARRKPRA
ncbi:ArsR/SmtB family transcription factor [Lysobacter sp. Hz 25]|uniref:ArsR/SmtB family transcription factor n=1 Tax=Lysobacter sp. Hz 25 TaxID=3383698 RepID=UPI0038D44E7B